MTGENGVKVTLQHLADRLEKSETDRREIWRHQGAMETNLKVQNTEMKGLREDVQEVRAQVAWMSRGVWGIFGTGVLILVQLFTSGKIG